MVWPEKQMGGRKQNGERFPNKKEGPEANVPPAASRSGVSRNRATTSARPPRSHSVGRYADTCRTAPARPHDDIACNPTAPSTVRSTAAAVAQDGPGRPPEGGAASTTPRQGPERLPSTYAVAPPPHGTPCTPSCAPTTSAASARDASCRSWRHGREAGRPWPPFALKQQRPPFHSGIRRSIHGLRFYPCGPSIATANYQHSWQLVEPLSTVAPVESSSLTRLADSPCHQKHDCFRI